MALPGFLGPAMTIELSPGAGALSSGGAAARSASSRKLSFSIQRQQQQNWCWAAVSTSVSHFYDASSPFTQCQVANTALSRNDCCSGGASDPLGCNQAWYLDVALRVTGNFGSVTPNRLTFSGVQAEIGKNAPLGARIGWFGRGGHFVVVSGWLVGESGTAYIDISDPIFLDSQIAYDAFASSYHSGGDWTHSYMTVPASAGGAVVAAAPLATFAPTHPESIGT